MFPFTLPPQSNNSTPISIYEIQTPSSEAGSFVFNYLREIKKSNEIPYIFQTLEKKFGSLSATWKEEVLYSSSVSEIVSNKSYLQIIALGEKALPLIFNEMKKQPDYWFVALSSITGGINPIKPENRGDLAKMTADWIEWASKNEYVS